MKIYKSLDDFEPLEKAVVTIGTFDGIHIGHRKVLEKLIQSAKEIGGESVLLTFFPHPRLILNPDDEGLRLINDLYEKIEILSHIGIDHLIITPFTRDFSNQNPEEYIREVLVNKIGTKTIVVGYDHRFGKNRSGSFDDLLYYSKIYGFKVNQIPEQDINAIVVSSTKIRESLIKGDINTTNLCLGYPFQMTGKVIRGQQLGRKIGFPTANLQLLESHKLIPSYGIYAIRAHIIELPEISTGTYNPKNDKQESYYGMGYIGNRPTVDGIERSIEVNIFNFNGDLYDKYIRVEFLHFIRYDEKFDTLEEMVHQLHLDEKRAKEVLQIN